MTRRSTTLLTTLGVALGGLVTAAPASAAYSATIGPLDTSTPGHVRGTVTTDAPGVVIWSKDDGNHGGIDWVTVRNHPGGAVDFDLSTWGIETGTIRVFACDADVSACDPGQDLAAFTATDVAPTSVTWPADTTIGEEPYAVQVTDAASGGGSLWVSTADGPFATYGLPAGSAPVARDGTATVIPLGSDGVQTLQLLRCDTLATPRACRPTGLTRAISLDREIHLITASGAHDVSTSATFTLTLEGAPADHPESTGPIDFGWQIKGSGLGTVASGTTTGLPVTNKSVKVTLPTAEIPEGAYVVHWTPRATNAAYGTVTGSQQFLGGFTVDHTPPPTPKLTASGTSVYPVQDRYRDYVVLRSTPGYVDGTSRVEIRNATGDKLLRTLPRTSQAANDAYSEYIWRGQRADGSLYPAGSYQTRVVHTDQAGNAAVAKGPNITVVRKHLSVRDWRRTVTAKASRIGQYVGACSRLRDPSGHGWTGSLGLLSNTRCVGQSPAGVVRTVHQVKAPAAVRYGGVEVDVYGGSARSSVSDAARICLHYWGNWSCSEVPSTVGWHPSGASGTVRWDQTVRWKAAVSSGKRYDVGSYRLRMRYWVLVDD